MAATNHAACRPARPGAAALLLSGHLVFPGAVLALCLVTETPAHEAVDWAGQSPAALAVDAMLVAHLGYAVALVTLMRGWRGPAACVGLAALAVSALVNFMAYFHVTGVYF